MRSIASVDSRRPAVSMKRKRMPSMLRVSSMVSRVVPSMSETMARSSPRRELRSVLLPAFVAPTMAVWMPLRRALPSRNESIRRVMCPDVPSTRAASLERSANSTSSSLKSSSSSIMVTSSSSSARIRVSSCEKPPFIWDIATLWDASDDDAITSATASACARSIFPFRNALCVNSPGLASLHPACISNCISSETIYFDA